MTGKKQQRVFLCAYVFFEKWSYETAESGMGGSEQHQCQMAWRLARRGYEVISYSHLPDNTEPQWRGSTWKEIRDCDYTEPGIWVIYRSPEALDKFTADHPGQRIWFMAQDEAYRGIERMTDERVAKVEKFIVLSPWHWEHFAKIHPNAKDKLVLSSNGIKCELIEEIEKEGLPERNPHKIVYTSSPDRGLECLLPIFNRAREWVDDLELHVYYGFNNIKSIIDLDPRFKYYQPFMDRLKGQIETTDRVIDHGRISQKELYREMFSAGLWVYPTQFCVSGETLVDMPRNYQNFPKGVPIKNLVGKSGFPIWCFNEETKKFQLSPVKWVKKTRSNAEVWRVDFDDGTYLRATPDHKVFIRTTAQWKRLRDLSQGDSLLHLGKHMMIQVGVQGGRQTWPTEHRLIAEYLTGTKLTTGRQVDHIDGNPWNNDPSNLQVISKAEHARKTFRGKPKSKWQHDKVIAGWHEYNKSLSSAQRSERGRNASKKFWQNMTVEQRLEFIRKREVTRMPAAIVGNKRKWEQATKAEREKMKSGLKLGPQANKEAWKNKSRQLEIFPNHKVLRVQPDGFEDVYDLYVDGPHNFVANGVVVHNCETSCIACMENQAMGAIPVFNPVAALKTNVQHGVLIEGDPYRDILIAARYMGEIVKLAEQPALQDAIRKEMMPWARSRFDWNVVVEQWTQWIEEGSANEANSVINGQISEQSLES